MLLLLHSLPFTITFYGKNNYIITITPNEKATMAVSPAVKLSAINEVRAGLKSKQSIAKSYGVSPKTLWQWCKNPPSLKGCVERSINVTTKKDIEAARVDIDNPLTTNNLLPLNVPIDAESSLLVDQFTDPRHTKFVQVYMQTRSPSKAWRQAFEWNKDQFHGDDRTKGNQLLNTLSIKEAVRQLNLINIRTFESDVLPMCLDFLTDSLILDPKDMFDDEGKMIPLDDMDPRVRMQIKKFKKKVHAYRVGTCAITGDSLFEHAESYEIEFHDKHKSVEIMGKIAALWAETNMSVNFTQNNLTIQQQKSREGMQILEAIKNKKDPMEIYQQEEA